LWFNRHLRLISITAARCVALRGQRYRDADSVSIFLDCVTLVLLVRGVELGKTLRNGNKPIPVVKYKYSASFSPAVASRDVFVLYRLLMQELQRVRNLNGEKYQLLTC